MQNQRIIKRYVAGLVVLLGSGCSTIHFDNGVSTPAEEKYSEYHHLAGLDLVELSEPVDLKQRCTGKGWHSVKTERTLLNGVVSLITQPFYSPWEVNYTCQQD